MTKLSLIVAMDEKRGIGKKGEIPWKIPGEQKRFKEITTPHPIIMGRKTFESIGRVLPERANLVITSDPKFSAEGIVVVHSLDEALEKAKELDQEEIFVIGGGQIFAQTIDKADKLYLSIVEGDFNCDTFFPDYSQFKKIIKKEVVKTEEYKYTYLELENKDLVL